MNKNHEKMQNVTISLPINFVDNLALLQEMGIVSSRSEAIREAIRDFLAKEEKVMELFNFMPEPEIAEIELELEELEESDELPEKLKD